MKKNSPQISQEEVRARISRMEQMKQLEKMQSDMKNNVKSGKPSSGSPQDVKIEDLRSINEKEEEVYEEVVQEWRKFLELVDIYLFSDARMGHYFPNNKITHLVKVFKRAHMELESRWIMDMFKSRVKEKNGGKVPTVSEKQGLFAKEVKRPLKVEEIAAKFEIEDDFPGGSDSYTRNGTKKGMMEKIAERFLQNDDVMDPLKAGPRKVAGMFIEAAGLMSPKSQDQEEKYFVAVFYTPDKIRPRSRTDRDNLVKFRTILKKAAHWVEQKNNELSSGDTAPSESDEPAKQTA